MASSTKGVDVVITVDGTAIGCQQDATLTETMDTYDYSCKTSGTNYKTVEPTYISWELSLDSVYSLPDVGDTLGFRALKTAFTNRTLVDVTVGYKTDLQGDMTVGDTVTYSGQAYITNYSVNFPNDNHSSLSLTLMGVGELTEDVKA